MRRASARTRSSRDRNETPLRTDGGSEAAGDMEDIGKFGRFGRFGRGLIGMAWKASGTLLERGRLGH